MNYNQFYVKGHSGAVEINFNNNTFTHYRNNNWISQDEVFQKEKYEREFLTPSLLTNAIIEIGANKTNIFNIDKIFDYLQSALCKYIVFSVNTIISLQGLNTIINTINHFNIHESLLLLNYSDELYSDEFAEIVLSTNRIKGIIIYNSPFNKNLENYIHYYRSSRKTINFDKYINEFVINPYLFSESLSHNTYFNRKIYFDINGRVKNAPECSDSFGLIQDLDSFNHLEKIVLGENFQKLWNVKKDDCLVCKDCEFRYFCVDNRLPIQQKGGLWYHEIECNYNPYIAKWRDEEGYKSLKECRIFHKIFLM